MYKKFLRLLTYNIKLILLILTGVVFLKALIFPNTIDILILFLLVLLLLGLA